MLTNYRSNRFCLAMADLYDSDEEELTIENDAVLTKYKTAGEISNLVCFYNFLNYHLIYKTIILYYRRLWVRNC